MAWTPTNKVINARVIAANILAFIAANQTEALTWANGSTGLLDFQEIEDSVANRDSPLFPSLALQDDNDAADYTGDMIDAVYSATFEIMIENSSPAAAVTQARVYATALSSLLANMDNNDLTSGMTGITAVLQTIETGFEEIKANDMQNSFLQVFQIRPTFSVVGGSY